MNVATVPWTWHSAQQTHRGKRRRNNEDAVLSRAGRGLWAVADGMGGHEAGEVASQAITAALGKLFLGGPLSSQVDEVEDALLEVNDRLRLHASVEAGGATIGSTVVAMLAERESAVVLWAGDSRLYRLRGERLEQITRDHNPVSDLLESGAVTEEEALAADTNIITRAVGAQPQLFLDVAVFDVRPYDTFLLCSDGLYREVPHPVLASELAARSVEGVPDRLLELSLEGAATDNISMVVVRPEPAAAGAAP